MSAAFTNINNINSAAKKLTNLMSFDGVCLFDSSFTVKEQLDGHNISVCAVKRASRKRQDVFPRCVYECVCVCV